MGTGLLLLVPLVAMQFTNEVNWSVPDFIIAGTLLFTTGTLLALVLKLKADIIYRVAFIVAIGTTFLMVWANLAVGLLGARPNLGNLMHIGVVAVLFTGIYLSRFKSAGLELAMFTTSFSLVLLAVIAVLAKMHQYLTSSVTEIIGVNLFFCALFIVSGLLFRFVALSQTTTK